MTARQTLRQAVSIWAASQTGQAVLVLVMFVAVFALVAAALGTDNNWDLRNYHLYNGMLAFDGRGGLDIAPAQEHSFDNRLLDTVFAALRIMLNSHPKLLLAAMAVPEAVAAYLAWRIALEVVPGRLAYRQSLAAAAVMFGATGIAGFATIGTTMTEMVQGSLMLGGLLVLIRHHRWVSWHIVLAGALFGAATGLKLVAATGCIGAVAALATAPGRPLRTRLMQTGLFGAGAGGALLAVAGPWWLHLYQTFGNPIFPYYNDIFRSPWAAADAMTDDGAKPTTWLMAAAYPFTWAFHRQATVTEAWSRDPRCAIAYCAVLAAAMASAWRGRLVHRPRQPAIFLLIFIAASYAAWQMEFSILRYLAPIEMLAGIAVLVAAAAVTPGRFGPHAAMLALLAVCVVRTDYPDWERVPAIGPAAQVTLPDLPGGSTVVMLDQSALSYIAAFAPPSVRFVGANNALVQPGADTRLSRLAERTIRDATGPLWGLEGAAFAGSLADSTLAYYKLSRLPGCITVDTNLGGDGERLCRLARDPA